MQIAQRRWYQNVADRPFAAALALLLVSGAVVALLNLGLTADVLASLVPPWLLTTLSVAYGIAGVLLLFGMATRHGDIEAAGCVLAASGIAIRGAALLSVIGVHPNTLATTAFYATFLWAVLTRLRQILRHEQIVRVRTVLKIEDES